ncbi:helix-turn-helix transcriptional regulator [Bacillus sp. BRMEA1]|uniref:helix-turn-helix domain-containing protein n=1 Tax=Neobacillus endophyticus TaxID=2738405 RepID=UPI001563ED58|nr:helix-turn-helix transcriptional regulator [Neobacillus endophyticus]NRD78596.1 helix-turn-helix transcriptional regulator [Neobacillus endophyticus]
MSEIVKVIGERLRLFRKRLGLSQEELDDRVSLHFTYIGQIERGEKNLTLESLEKILVGLEITFEELFHNVTPKGNKTVLAEIIENLEYRSLSDQKTVLRLLEL